MGMQKRQAILSFLDHEDAIFATQKPFYSNMPFSKTPGASTTNIKSVQHEISIANIRGFEDKFSLDRNGFELVSHSTKFNAWKDGERLVQEHYPVMEDFLRKKLGAEEVVIYDHTDKHYKAEPQGARIFRPPKFYRSYWYSVFFAPMPYPSPTKAVGHTNRFGDVTPEAVVDAIKEAFGPRAGSLLEGRHRVINIWRPLAEPVEHRPLALCDYTTATGDGVPTDLVFPHTVTEIYTLTYSPLQQWYYMDRQMMNEVWLLKMMDSDALKDLSIAKYTPHTSFEDPAGSPESFQPRQSLEMRAYVFG